MKAVVVGCGAMGATYASALARAGHDVQVLEASAALVDQINRHGLKVIEPDGSEQVARLTASLRAGDLDAPDFVLFFVKATHNADAAAAAASLVGDSTIVATVQNGWGHAEVLSRVVPAERLVIGVTYHGANTVGLGEVAHYFDGSTDLGPWEDGANLDAAEAVAGLLRSGGFKASATPDVKTAIWKKLALNAGYSPTAALTGLPVAGLLAVEPLRELCESLVREAAIVAHSAGIEIDPDEILAKVAVLGRSTGGAGIVPGKASMALDVEARRPTEIDAINGAVVSLAGERGVDAPLNQALFALVKGLEYGWRQ